LSRDPTGRDIVIEPNDLRSRVARGSRLLDEWEPGWAARIALADLDMSRCDRCILGQLFLTCNFGLRLLFTVEEIEEDQEIDFGFERNIYAEIAGFDEYAELAEAWRAEVLARTGGNP
jgi:hypothetical protein